MLKRFFALLLLCSVFPLMSITAAEALNPTPFGADKPKLDSWAVGEWWNNKNKKGLPFELNVPRDQVVAFTLYTHDQNILKITAQLFPLKPDEPQVARLEVQRDGAWVQIAESPVLYPGWSAHFRITPWDNTKDVPYRVRHGDAAQFGGIIRHDPIEKETIVVGSLSCNSSKTNGPRPEMVANLLAQNPDVLFFAGDQTYRHTEHTVGWIEFGLQFRDVMKDRPTITIPDDHDVGHHNLWGENGKKTEHEDAADGGYLHPAVYVNMVERQQAWHLPDPVDPAPIQNGIGTYFTRLRVGGIDFAILEDRKFKSGPLGKIPNMGPRPDHITDPSYDRSAINLPGLQLLGERQEKWLASWTEDWTGAQLKCVLSQTAFCGAVHMHGGMNNRLLADLDCNGWPQKGRDAALTIIRRAWAPHICGDQHLAVLAKHGISNYSDGPWGFTSPAIVNTVYGRWWHPLDEKAGPNPVVGSPLPWTGDFEDGLGNKISMVAYANPIDNKDELKRADGYGMVRFHKKLRQMTFECWPRFCKATDGDTAQFPGWPVTADYDGNDGRTVVGYLPEMKFDTLKNPVVQVIEQATGEILYTVRVQGDRFQPRIYRDGTHTVKYGKDRPDGGTLPDLTGGAKGDGRSINVP